MIQGYTDTDATTGNASLSLIGSTADTALDTAKTTSALAGVHITANITNGGTGLTSPGADENLLAILSHGTTRFIFDQEGSGHADIAWTTYGVHDDMSLISEMEETLLAIENPSQTPRRHAMEATGIIGKGSWHMEDGKPRAMVNFTKLAMLHHGALIQAGDRFAILETALDAKDNRILALEAQIDTINRRLN